MKIIGIRASTFGLKFAGAQRYIAAMKELRDRRKF
jgi:hypothetical protein